VVPAHLHDFEGAEDLLEIFDGLVQRRFINDDSGNRHSASLLISTRFGCLAGAYDVRSRRSSAATLRS